MSEQRHIIKRQIIELEMEGQGDAYQLQTEVSRIYRQQIAALIEETCNALSTPDQIHRISSLEIDLGDISRENFEAEFITKLKPALHQALSIQINQQEQTAQQQNQSLKTQSQLELFIFFIRTGSLPWWADATQTNLLSITLQHLIQTPPASLRHLIHQLVGEKRALQRLINHYSDEQLVLLTGLLAPALKQRLNDDFATLCIILQKTKIPATQNLTQLRQNLWSHSLQVASFIGRQSPSPPDFYQAVLRRVAKTLKITYNTLLNIIAQVLSIIPTTSPTLLSASSVNQDDIDSNQELKQLLAILFRTNERQLAPQTEPTAPAETDLQSTEAFLPNLWQLLETFARQQPTATQPQLRTALQSLQQDAATKKVTLPDIWQSILYLLQSASPDLVIAPTSFQELPWLPELQQLAVTRGWTPEAIAYLTDMLLKAYQTDLVNEMASPVQPLNETTKSLKSKPSNDEDTLAVDEIVSDLRFSDAEELYIGNAGLVILWPFLKHFFTHLGLLTRDGQFKEPAAQQRAISLLQYLATAETAFPEYLLPLNKVLGGLELTAVYQLTDPLSEDEMQECTTLLEAVIAQASILRNMSVAGLRGTFLLRQGVLSSRDGAWLLQVERETYDVVLDRFPWGWTWVKLPWMKAPLRVEW